MPDALEPTVSNETLYNMSNQELKAWKDRVQKRIDYLKMLLLKQDCLGGVCTLEWKPTKVA